MNNPDIKQASEFLELFNYQLITFQFLKKSKPAGYYTAATPLQKKDWDYLISQHKQQKEIFFMVNEGDGEVKEGKSIPRSQKNVTRITSLFIDTDEIPFSEVKAFLKEIGLKPHIVVETSPKKYHLYFLLEESQTLLEDHRDPQSLLRNWKHCQTLLSHLGTDHPRTDSSVKDSSRVLRVPGFFHLKNPKASHQTQVKQLYSHQPYSLDEIRGKLDQNSSLHPQHQALQNTQETESIHPLGYQPPIGKVGKGNRHAQMVAQLGHLLAIGVSPHQARQAFYFTAQEQYEDGKEFLPNGKRHHEVDDFISFKLDDLKEEDKHAQIQRKNEVIKQLDNSTNSLNSLELPDDFYFNAPGIVGEITKEICSTAHYPVPSISFAAAVSLVSALKGKSVKSSTGAPPTNYFLCLAPTGAGKNYPQEVVQHTLQALRKPHLLENKVRSDRGVLRWLEASHGTGLLVFDEAEELLQSIENKNSGQHLRNFKTLLLELYTATNTPNLSFGRVENSKQAPTVLNYPHLSTILIGTPNILQTAFTKKSISDGLFQRFNILFTNKPRIANPNSSPATHLPPNTFNHLKQIINITALIREDSKNPQKIISIEANAERYIKELQEHYDDLYNEELKEKSGLEGIYSRSLEKSLRLATALAQDTITLPILTYANDFVSANTEQMIALAQEQFNVSEHSRNLTYLQQFIAKNSNREGVCTYRKIVRESKFQRARELKELLQMGVEAGFLIEHKRYKKGTKAGRPGTGYSVGEIG